MSLDSQSAVPKNNIFTYFLKINLISDLILFVCLGWSDNLLQLSYSWGQLS
jgi:hypothetical protein